MKTKIVDKKTYLEAAEKKGYDGQYFASIMALPMTYFQTHIRHCPICWSHVQFELARLEAESQERLKQKRANTPTQTL